MKKRLLIGFCLIALVITTIVTTVALLTSQDFDNNTMTIGKASIVQKEYERETDTNGNFIVLNEPDQYGFYPEKLKEFKQDKPMLPVTVKDMKWDQRPETSEQFDLHMQSWGQVGAQGANNLYDKSISNVIDKFVFVENNGSVDVYTRTIFAIEAPEGAIETKQNFNKLYEYDYIKINDLSTTIDPLYVTIDGQRYRIVVAYYNINNGVLKVNETARPGLLQAYMPFEATNEDIEKYCANDTEGACKVDIKVLSQAVQSAGFANARTALNTGFGEVTEAKVLEWFSK